MSRASYLGLFAGLGLLVFLGDLDFNSPLLTVPKAPKRFQGLVAVVQWCRGHQPLAGDQAEPEEGGHPRVGGVLGGAAMDLKLGLLEDVGGVDAALEPAVQPQPDPAAQPGARAGEQLGEGVRVPDAGAAQQLIARVRTAGRGSAHKSM
jgi:hypothetical protein